VRDECCVATLTEGDADDRRAHAVHALVAGGAIVDLSIGELHRGRQPVLGQREVRINGEGPGGVFLLRRLIKSAHAFGRHARSHIARLMAPHTIGHQVQLVLWEDVEAILVVVALQPNVCQSYRRDPHAVDRASQLVNGVATFVRAR
jgi:hypothetical protein